MFGLIYFLLFEQSSHSIKLLLEFILLIRVRAEWRRWWTSGFAFAINILLLRLRFDLLIWAWLFFLFLFNYLLFNLRSFLRKLLVLNILFFRNRIFWLFLYLGQLSLIHNGFHFFFLFFSGYYLCQLFLLLLRCRFLRNFWRRWLIVIAEDISQRIRDDEGSDTTLIWSRFGLCKILSSL